MKFFIDSEFISDGKTIDLVSIGIVCEDGDSLYLECSEFNPSKATPWVRENVLAHLTQGTRHDHFTIKHAVEAFIESKCEAGNQKAVPEFWGDYCAFDFVLLSQLFGTFDTWPQGWPFFMHDLQQFQESVGLDAPEFPSNHNALDDAKIIRLQYLDLAAEQARQKALRERDEEQAWMYRETSK